VNIGDQEKLAESFPRVHDADIAARSPSFNALPQWSCEPRVERPPARGSDGKMKMLHNLRVRTKLFVAYGLFILPVTFLFSVIIGKSSGDIDFARKEILGTRYIVVIRQVQDAVLRCPTRDWPSGSPWPKTSLVKT
jgi:hypothetical protein